MMDKWCVKVNEDIGPGALLALSEKGYPCRPVEPMYGIYWLYFDGEKVRAREWMMQGPEEQLSDRWFDNGPGYRVIAAADIFELQPFEKPDPVKKKYHELMKSLKKRLRNAKKEMLELAREQAKYLSMKMSGPDGTCVKFHEDSPPKTNWTMGELADKVVELALKRMPKEPIEPLPKWVQDLPENMFYEMYKRMVLLIERNNGE